MLLTRLLVATATLSGFLLAGDAYAGPQSTGDAVARSAAAARPMTVRAVEELYANRTWKWRQGGGFFSAGTRPAGPASKPRSFAAWSREGSLWSYGEGDWYVSAGGKLCMRALWTGKTGRAGAITCFLHREDNGVIYQKKSIGGEWYVFRHNPARKDDEAARLIRGDRVGKEVSRLKARVR